MDRQICTKTTPYTPSKKGPWQHPDAVYKKDVEQWDGEVAELYECPNCGKRFEVTIPR